MTDIKTMGNLDAFSELESLEFKVPMVCPVTGCVPRRRD